MLPVNVPAVLVFVRNISQMTRRGFNYQGLESGLRLSGQSLTPDQFAGLRTMERTWTTKLNEA